MRRLDAATVLLLALCAAGLLGGLGRFPALTSDEAWVGLFAGRLTAHGLYTPHEMNSYTGPLYGLILARVFAAFGQSVATLRLFGAAANALAAALVALLLRRRAGAAAAAWWALLLAGSSYFLLKSRLAWDVYALQPLLLALALAALDGPATLGRALALAVVCVVGAQNHFIFLSVPASLCLLFAARALKGDRAAGPWLRASLSALVPCALLFLVKPRLSEAAWALERAWAVPLFCALPFLAAAVFAAGPWEKPLLRLVSRRALGAGFALGLAAFAVWHLLPLAQALAGPTVWKRVLSWDAPFPLDAPLWAWSALLLAAAGWRAARAWHGREPLSPLESVLALWPAAYAAIFILFRNTSSLRYYSPIQFLTLASASAGLARLPRPDRKYALALGLFAAAAAQAVFWREQRAPVDRRPLTFKIGWHAENSWDFARKDALFAAYDESGACGIGRQEDSFVAVPLDFHREADGARPCDAGLTFEAVACRDCVVPPFFSWKTRPR